MTHQLPELPYPRTALAPLMSEETLNFHYGKHHNAYVVNLNKLIPGTEFENASLEDIIRKASGGIFNNGAQVWNHTFFWHCLTPNSSKAPSGKLAEAIATQFGSFDNFKMKFAEAATTQFGSGWAWLVKTKDGSLAIEKTPNADNPLRDGKMPLLTCDVWEHAYYIDFRNARPDYVTNFWNLVNWKFVEENFGK
ncbi:MAG: superoxide dismutase [bacterium]|nr:superoxide dismutase [bacterium]